MRLIDADELIEHAWRNKLDSRELIAEMIEKAPTIKEIPTRIPIDIFEKLVSQQPRWIPCNERMPKEENKTYWICTNYGYQCECRWTNVNPFWTDLTTDWHWHIADVPQYSKVVAWMPFPEPYREERTEE